MICLLTVVLAMVAGTALGNDDLERTKLHEDKLWQRSSHQMASISVNNAAVGSLLTPLLGYQFLLPKTQLRAGLAYLGPRTRLRRFVRDLLTGRKPMRIGAIGGSITCGQGTSNATQYGWFSVLGRWLVDSLPGLHVSARNGAVPATPSAFMIMCLELSVDPDVDLVLVEYQVNDGMQDKVYNNEVVRGMERLLRRLLDLPGRPAVVFMQVPTHGMAQDPPDAVPFHVTMEDLQGALSQYYDVQYLSMRTALFKLAAVQRHAGFTWRELFVDHHPGDAGNRVMADLAAFLIQETALDLLLDPFTPEEEAQAREGPLPPPMYKGNLPPTAPMCLLGEGFKAVVTLLPDPSSSSSSSTTSNTTTATGPSLLPSPPPYPAATPYPPPGPPGPPAPPAPPPDAVGFFWVVEGHDPQHPKVGYVANRAGSELRLRLDTRRAEGAEAGGEDRVAVFFHHLRSYQHMGVAEFSCVSGCTCERQEVDAHIAEHISQTYLVSLLVSQSAACEVAVRVLPRTTSGEHKFKISGVVISESPRGAGVVSQMADQAGAVRENLVATNVVIAASASPGGGGGGAGVAGGSAAAAGGRRRSRRRLVKHGG
ncbi:hypothetical protein Agub_g9472 [Astrephomene gubernaculifera]|uniref:SGNH hydrolase-type esterase domain-containing protein n=1 Tax=Astrephomene gubernaculifera TaxID=47775 RepID=A0AAD3HP06_9CHLO|nr:hypothetical protein Agub_g9472 [Astrephomene gubernaculifera]